MLQHHSKFEARIKFTTKNDGDRIVYALFTFLVQKSKQETGLKKQAPTSKTHLDFCFLSRAANLFYYVELLEKLPYTSAAVICDDTSQRAKSLEY